jgi:hypothetical protein
LKRSQNAPSALAASESSAKSTGLRRHALAPTEYAAIRSSSWRDAVSTTTGNSRVSGAARIRPGSV